MDVFQRTSYLARNLLPLVAAIAACDSPAAAPIAQELDAATVPLYKDPSQPVEARVEDLLARMTLDEKLGQMTMSDWRWGYVNADVVTELGLGGVLSGGDSAPDDNTPTGWADTIDGLKAGARATRLGIPLLYGTDAVHGHALVVGATVFPHNLGLGASRDPELVRRVGAAAGAEIAATGVDWAFAPVLAVTRDDHWGRVYESFGEVTAIPTSMTTMISGLQSAGIMATAKHYVGDGGTLGGDDQGDTVLSEAELRSLHLPPFIAAIEQGVSAVMVSYSSWNGARLHASRYLVNDVLKGELGFSGIVVTDWNGLELLDGDYGHTPEEVRAGIEAGIDMFMIIEQYRLFIIMLRTEVQEGRVPLSRIDDANRRILRKKFELGLFEQTGVDRSQLAEVGSPAHRAIAREAVQKSLVVLKNQNDVLPIPYSAAKIFVAGKNADDIGHQSGGWTVTWQGGSGATTPGTSILTGIRQTVNASTTVTYEAEGLGIDGSYDVAIAVIGEAPYAEYEGDREDDLTLDATDLATLARLHDAGVPVVTVLVAGRPLDVTDHIGEWDAFVAAFLPGSEGKGVADVLFGVVSPSGTLPLTWMQHATQQPINEGDGKTPLFALGAGLSYPAVPAPEDPGQPGRSARDTLRAESYSAQQGTQLEPCGEPGCGQNVGWIAPGDFLAYADVDFGAVSPATFEARVASGAGSGTIEVRLDSVSGPIIASLAVAPTGGWTAWTTRSSPAAATGRHTVYLTFAGPGGDFVNLNWFRFR